jgi:hypothetical protein
MSKGLKSRTNNVYTAKVRDIRNTEYSIGNGGGGGGSSETVKTCWDFQIMNPTSAVDKVKQYDVVKGSIISEKQLVLIRFDSKPLGYAPFDISQKIIEASKSKVGYLVGEVTSKAEGKENISIHLCLT